MMTLNWRDCNRINKCISLNTCSSRKKLKQLLSGQTINISTVVTKSPVTLSLDASFHNKSHETNCTTQFFFFFSDCKETEVDRMILMAFQRETKREDACRDCDGGAQRPHCEALAICARSLDAVAQDQTVP